MSDRGADGKGVAGHRDGNTEEGVGAGIGSGHLTESGYGAIVLEAVEVGGACVRLAVDVVPNGARGEQVAETLEEEKAAENVPANKVDGMRDSSLSNGQSYSKQIL